MNYGKARHFAFGYIAHFSRSSATDAAIERALREQGLSDEAIAVWLTSTDGRHVMDNCDGLKRRTVEAAYVYFTRGYGKGYIRGALDSIQRWRSMSRLTPEKQELARKAGLKTCDYAAVSVFDIEIPRRWGAPLFYPVLDPENETLDHNEVIVTIRRA